MFHFSLFKIKTFLGGNISILLNSIARGYNPCSNQRKHTVQ